MKIQSEAPGGARPGNTFTLKSEPASIIAVFWGAGFFIPPENYTLSGKTITTKSELQADDSLWVIYIPAL